MKVSCREQYFSSQSVYEYEPDHRLDRAIEDSRLEYEKKKGRR